MQINVITPFPDAISAHMGMSIMKRAVEKNAVAVNCVDPRHFAADNYGTIDDHPYGGTAAGVTTNSAPTIVRTCDSIWRPRNRPSH